MIFIITILLLAADFYYLKNIAGRRLVGLRWWNEVDAQTGDSQWVFESSEPGTKTINPTDSRFFWLALYTQPILWVLLAIFALVRLQFLWLPLVGKSDQNLALLDLCHSLKTVTEETASWIQPPKWTRMACAMFVQIG
ncbi:golgi apparatus membrane protein TVP23 [Colletotrichum higginsianum]|nr:golgi apparatus membrane protein TVP23 [Colletotrichum higginsianum]